jgi:hypothetical protein
MVSKATVLSAVVVATLWSKVIVATVIRGNYCDLWSKVIVATVWSKVIVETLWYRIIVVTVYSKTRQRYMKGPTSCFSRRLLREEHLINYSLSLFVVKRISVIVGPTGKQ